MANKEKEPLQKLFDGGYIHFNVDNNDAAINLCKDLFVETNSVIFENQERPDILIISDKKIYGIEHFEFDDFKRRKGSTGKATIKKFEKDFLKEFDDASISDGYFRKSIDLDKENLLTGYDFFVNNFLETFNEHYEKIDEYKQNIHNFLIEKNLDRDIEILFFIENSSPFSPLITKEGYEKNLFLPFNSKEILEKLNSIQGLNGIIYLTRFNEDMKYIHSFNGGKMNNEIIEKEFYFSTSKTYVSDTIIVIPKDKLLKGE